jgi:hypothetical protein
VRASDGALVCVPECRGALSYISSITVFDVIFSLQFEPTYSAFLVPFQFRSLSLALSCRMMTRARPLDGV